MSVNDVKIKINQKGMQELDKEMNRFLTYMGDVCVEETKKNTPVKTGALRDSIEIKEVDLEGKKITYGSNLPYAIFVENGTPKTSAKNYFKKTLYMITNLLKV